MTTQRASAAVAIALVGAVAIAGCTNESAAGSGSSTTNVTGSAAPSSSTHAATPTPAPAPAPPAASSTTTPAGGGTATCQIDALKVALLPGDGFAGGYGYQVIFTNIGASTCIMNGHPGVSLADSGGAQIGASATKNDQAYQLTNVTLAPSQQAASVIFIYDSGKYNNTDCQPKQATAMRVYPPDDYQSKLLPISTTGCAAKSVELLAVSPVFAFPAAK